MSAAAIDYLPDPALSFWPTPREVADDLVQRTLCPGFGLGGAVGDVPTVRVLEPSAGDGHLAQSIRQHLPDAHITCVEPSAQRAERVRQQDGLADEVIEATLEDYLVHVAWMTDPYDVVIMNPPFTLPGRAEAWAEHFLAIYHDPFLLAPYGQISAVVPRIVMTGKSKLVRQVRELLDPHHIEECPQGSFDPVGAKLSTARIWIEKVSN